MGKDTLLKLAENIRDGKATKEEKLKFFQTLDVELGGISDILNNAKKN